MPEDLHLLKGLPNGFYQFTHTSSDGRHICGETVKTFGSAIQSAKDIPNGWVVPPFKVGLWVNGVFTQIAQNLEELDKYQASQA